MSATAQSIGSVSSLPARSERVYQGALTAGFASLGFFVLFSTAGTNLSLAILLVLAVLSPARLWRSSPWREPVMALGLVLLAYIALRTFIGEGLGSGSLHVVNQYHELLLVVLLWALILQARQRAAFFYGLAAGALFFAALHWVVPLIPKLGPFLEARRISGSFGMAVTAFVLYERARLGQLDRRFGYGAAAILAGTILFATQGRTGHLILLFLVGCAAWRTAPRRIRVPAVIAIVAAVLLLASTSQSVRNRVHETISATQSAGKGETQEVTSTGIRIELLKNALAVARDNWLLGTGWQGYREAFKQAAVARHGDVSLPGSNPHNEYLMQIGAGGLPALVLFLVWLAAPVWRAGRGVAANPWSGTLACVALAFALGSLFNSLLLDFIEGHFYTALLPWLMAQGVRE